jgi:hypothetical protein
MDHKNYHLNSITMEVTAPPMFDGKIPALEDVELELGSVDLKYLGRPIQVMFCGKMTTYYETGRGAYPYDCPDRAKHPDSVIYTDYEKGAWVASHDLIKQPGGHYTLKNW